MARILVVDDDEIILNLVKDCLDKYAKKYYSSDWDLSIDIVSSAIDALGLVKDNNYELIITDILMAKMDGWEFIRELRKRFPMFKIPVFVMSAIKGAELEYQAAKHGVSKVFSKPLSPKAFSQEVFSFIKGA